MIFLNSSYNFDDSPFTNQTPQSVLTIFSEGKRLRGGAAIMGCFQLGLTLLLNSAVFLFIVMRYKLRRQISKKLYLNLQGINITLNVIVIASVFYISGFVERIITNALLFTKFLSLVLTTADRYVCIVYPYRYKQLTNRSAFVTILLSWVPAVVFTVTGIAIGTIDDRDLCIVQITAFLLASVVLIGSNVKIYTIAKKH